MIKIQSKITTVTFVVAFMSCLLLGYVSILRSKQVVEREAKEKMFYQTKSLSAEFEIELTKINHSVGALESVLINYFPSDGINSQNIEDYKYQLNTNIYTLLKLLHPFSLWIVFNPDLIEGEHTVSYYYDKDKYMREEEYSINQLDINTPEMRWWNDAIKNGEVWTKPYFWKNWNLEIISYSKAISIKDTFIACIGSDFNFTQTNDRLKNTKVYDTGFVFILDENFNFIIHPTHKGKNINEILTHEQYQAIYNQYKDNPTGNFHYKYGGEQRVATYYTLSNKWILALSAPVKEIYNPLYQISSSIVIVIAIISIFSLLIAIFISKSITDPLQTLVSLFKKGAEGHLETRAHINTRDEIQELGYNFNLFMSQMQQQLHNLKEQEKELLFAKNKAEESDRLKTEFLGNLSHEIRTPLYAITGFTQLMNQPYITEEEKRTFADLIQYNNDKLLRYIDDILIFSELEQGLIIIKPERIEISPFIFEVSQEFIQSYDLATKQIQFHTNLPKSDFKTFINTDRRLLKKLIEVMLDNAYKFTPSGIIEFGLTIDHSSCSIFISDTGVGIPDELKETIFNKFFKYATNNQVIYEGSGIGLSIAKNIAQLIGTKINITKIKKSGVCFSISFHCESLTN
jgi:signal transduction histidine kinase